MFNNVVLIVLVWNEYRMGSCMFKWIPSLLDALIPFTVGALQAALILTTDRPVTWLIWLTAFYAAGMFAFENMYRRSAAEERNGFVLQCNRPFRRLNSLCSLGMASAVGALAAVHLAAGTRPGTVALAAVSLGNLLFLLRGEANWQLVVRATRRAVEAHPAPPVRSARRGPPLRPGPRRPPLPATWSPAIAGVSLPGSLTPAQVLGTVWTEMATMPPNGRRDQQTCA